MRKKVHGKKGRPMGSTNKFGRGAEEIGIHEIWDSVSFHLLMCPWLNTNIDTVGMWRSFCFAGFNKGGMATRGIIMQLFISGARAALLSTGSGDDFEASSRPRIYFYPALSTKEGIKARSRRGVRRRNKAGQRDRSGKLGQPAEKWGEKGGCRKH